MNIKSITSKVAVFVIAFSLALPSQALITVVDPVNLVQTAMTARHQVMAYALQIKQWQEFILTNRAKLKNLQGMMGGEMASAIAATLLGNAGELEKTLKDGMEIADTLKSWYGASKKSPQEFLDTLAKQQKAGDKKVETWMAAYQSNGAAIQEAHKSFMEVAQQIKAIGGPTEGLQALTASVGILVKQNASIMGIQQLETLDRAEEQAKKNQSLKGQEIVDKTLQERLKAARSAD